VKTIVSVLLAAVVIVGVMAGLYSIQLIALRSVPVASSNAETLTNSDVIMMSNAHLSDEAIIGAIDSMHGDVSFDVRPDALVALENAGVGDNAIETVVQKNRAATGSYENKLIVRCAVLLVLLVLGIASSIVCLFVLPKRRVTFTTSARSFIFCGASVRLHTR
jgi:hypothetical protein